MAKSFDCLSRRRTLSDGSVRPDKLSQIGRDLVVAGNLSDALDFLGKARDVEALARLVPVAIDEGDLFIFTRVKKALEEEIQPEELDIIIDSARRHGKESFALQAEEMMARKRNPEKQTGSDQGKGEA